MEIFHSLPEFPPAQQTIVALGNFDGVHRGHQALITRTVQKANEVAGRRSVILTFEPHPLKLLKPRQFPKLLLTNSRKESKIAELGADVLIFLPFTHALASMISREFVEMLYRALRSCTIVVGFNYSFGYQGQGNPTTLKTMGTILGFEVDILPPQKDGMELISSTNIRQALAEGKVDQAQRLLGYWPILEGKVISGEKRGRKLGFPTANVDIAEDILLPRLGVYAANAVVNQKLYQAVVNIGNKPTFGNGRPTAVEVHLLDFQGDLYGTELELHLLKYLRSEKRFTNSRNLVEQIKEDIRLTRTCNRYL